MKYSAQRILTSHVGSLPRSPELYARLQEKEATGILSAELAGQVAASVADFVGRE